MDIPYLLKKFDSPSSICTSADWAALLKMDDEEPPQPPPLPQQPSQPPRPHRRGPKITIHHDEHQRPHIPVSDRQPSSSTRTVFNGADFNIPEGESFLRNFNSFMDNASQENPQNMGRGGNRSGGRSGSNLPQYYDN